VVIKGAVECYRPSRWQLIVLEDRPNPYLEQRLEQGDVLAGLMGLLEKHMDAFFGAASSARIWIHSEAD